MLWACAGLSLVLGVAGYAWTGRPDALNPASSPEARAEQRTAAQPADAAGMTREQFEALVGQLAQRMKDTPEAEGLFMLGRSHMVLNQAEQAVPAYRQSLALRPDHADTWADLADALAATRNGSLAGEPMQAVERALKLAPDHLKALSLAGTAALQAGDKARALELWDKVVRQGPPDHGLVQMARNAAEEVRGGTPPATAAPATPPSSSTPAPASIPASVRGTVALGPQAKDQVSPDHTLFITARAVDANGQPTGMPLAVLRRQVRDLPLEFELNDAMAMSPAARLSQAARVVVTARVSASGQAAPSTGDWLAQSAPMAPVGAAAVQLVLNGQRR